MRRAGSKIDCEEVLYAAFHRAFERADQLRDPRKAEAWVGRVVRNVLLDELGKRGEPVLLVHEPDFVAPDGDGTGCWCVLAQAEQLKPAYAAILRRVVVDGVPVSQAAAELGLTPNNATVRLHRARKALKERLRDHCGTTTAQACSDCGCAERGCCPRP